MFPISSRYYSVQVAQMVTASGKIVSYLRRRFISPPERFQVVQEHTVTDGDRLDRIAAQYLGDPEQFWRVADPNNVLRPEELTETPGQKLLITLPEGISGDSL